MSDSKKQVKNPSRRKFVKTAAYVAPVILTLKASSSFAAVGSFSPNTTGSLPGSTNKMVG